MTIKLHCISYKYIKTILSCLVFCCLSACSKEQIVIIEDTKGEAHHLTGRNLPIVLAYWAEWCSTCRSEVAQLNELDASGDVAVYGVYYSPTAMPEKIAAHALEMGIQFPVLSTQPDAQLRLPEVSVIPAHFIIKTDGKIIGPLLGPQSSGTIIQVSKN